MTMTSTYAFSLTSNGDQASTRSPYSHSHSRSYHRARAGSRLAAPVPLPRIPSERFDQLQDSLAQSEAKTHDHKDNDPFTSDNESTFRTNHLTPTSAFDNNGQVDGHLDDKLSLLSNLDAPPGSHHYNLAYPPTSSLPRTPTRLSPAKHHTHIHDDLSTPTRIMLEWMENYPLLHGILAQRDSRRVFYFMLLNLTFMVIQSTYGFLTGSLGLISDSVHMFFDCVALFMGVCAAVMTKWPASVKFPYGYGKIDTLAGLANGVFLMLISVEIVYEAIERLCEGAELSRTTELLVVSSLGLGINIVGMMSFDHGHHHGHSHSGHDHGHVDLDHSHDHSSRSRSSSPSKAERPKKKKEAHSHGSENMHGIYLHIMADALGSVAVVVSTILVRLTEWTGWDPLASCVIAVMIFISAIPLVMSTAGKLLLSLDPDIEYNLRDILGGLSELRGVIGYTVPKFWLNDIQKETGHSHHHHGPTHAHNHNHSHDHHDHSHNHQPVANHDHDHQHHEHTSDVNPPDHRHADKAPILGIIHVIASQNADLGDVRQRTSQYLKNKNLDLIVQTEREGEGRCWCGGGLKTN